MLSPETRILTGNETRVLKEFRENNTVVASVGWGQTGSDKVLDVYVQFDYRGSLIRLTTRRGHVLTATPDHPCFGRLDPGNHLHYFYLMERSSLGYRLGLTQNLMQDLLTQQKVETDLFNPQDVQDRVWIIEATDSTQQAQYMLRYATFRYGLPDIPFRARGGALELSDSMIRDIFDRIDTPSRARQLLADSLMFEAHPHVMVKLSASAEARSSAVQFVLFGGERRGKELGCYEHLIRVDGSVAMKDQMREQFQRRMTRQGFWHLEVTRGDLEEAQLFVKTLSALDNLQVIKKIQLTRNAPFYILPASHIKLGMVVPVIGTKGVEEDAVVKVSTEEYKGPLYDLKVGALNNYVADGLVVMANAGFLTTLPVTDPPLT